MSGKSAYEAYSGAQGGTPGERWTGKEAEKGKAEGRGDRGEKEVIHVER